MKQAAGTYRIVSILRRLNDGKALCVSALAQEFDVSVRTLRRDFELIRDIFGDFLAKEGECWRAYKRFLLDEVLHASDLMTLSNIVTLFDVARKQSAVSDKTRALIRRSEKVYDFKTRPFEHIGNIEVLRKLEHAVRFRKRITVDYRTERHLNRFTFDPYRIVFLNENFYVAGVHVDQETVELRRVNMIEAVAYTSHTFFAHADVVRFFERIQTPWAAYGKPDIEVRLRVGVKVRRFFLKKRFLPSQEIVGTFDNGDIEVRYTVSNPREIEELIVKWLPQVRIIEPKSLIRFMRKTLNKKLQALSTPLP